MAGPISSLLLKTHKKETEPPKEAEGPTKPEPPRESTSRAMKPSLPTDQPAYESKQEPTADEAPQGEAEKSALTRLHDAEKAPATIEVEVPEDKPLSFKDRLDELDRLIQLDTGITAFTIDTVRSHVKQIMVDLKEQPELDSILIDRDVHNILLFIRTVKEKAVIVREDTKEKKVKKSKKGGLSESIFAGKNPLMPVDLKGLGNLKT